ncbi:uncharacterized protein LOC142171862 [Nicotiana tabacum]|uniref:Uncharacterized protein LOC142171862 n=1 Tax=Nicotiana tabacum TaxID=4097 RepID=A0AC58T371_TOBAC
MTIAYMITAGFTGQLKGWWDNCLKLEQRAEVMGAVKIENGQNVQNNVYTFVLNIIEHFSGRWSDNSETIRTMLQNLRCKTLISFRWYKDVFLSKVMELLECNSTHWKSKFIDGLPTLFAERVRKALRGTSMSINYDRYLYEKLISVCTQEGLAMYNEIKLIYEIKKYRLNKRQQLGEFCEQFAIDIPKIKKSHRHKKEPEKPYRYKKKNRGSSDKRFKRKDKRKKAYKHRKNFIKSDTPNIKSNTLIRRLIRLRILCKRLQSQG